MTREEIVGELQSLAEELVSTDPATASSLLILAGAVVSGQEMAVNDLLADWVQEEIRQLQAGGY